MKITKRKDGYYATTVQFNGVRKQFSGKDKSKIEAKAIEYLSLKSKGIDLSANITVKNLANEWFTLCQSKNEKSTQKRVRGILDNYIIKELGHIQVKNLKTHQIQKMLNDIQESHTDTTRKTLQIIKSILEYGINNDYCYKNVANSYDGVLYYINH